MFQAATNANPSYAKAFVNLGLVYLKLKDKKKAKELFLHAKEIDKGYFSERLKSAKSKYGDRIENIEK